MEGQNHGKNVYQSLDLLQAERSAGKLLDPVDEQRLRDHQLRRLRKLWLKDQIIAPEEPLMPPQNSGFIKNFFDKHWFPELKHRKLGPFLAHTGPKDWRSFMLYKAFRGSRFIGAAMAIGVPAAYFINYVSPFPADYSCGDDTIYPGDDYFRAKRSELSWDPYTASYKLKPVVVDLNKC